MIDWVAGTELSEDRTVTKNSMEYIAFLHQLASLAPLGINESTHSEYFRTLREAYEHETGNSFPLGGNVEIFQLLDAEGFWSSSDSFLAMRNLAGASIMEERARMIQYLLDQNPTTDAQATLANDILSDASASPDFRTLLLNLNPQQLESELATAHMKQVHRWYAEMLRP